MYSIIEIRKTVHRTTNKSAFLLEQMNSNLNTYLNTLISIKRASTEHYGIAPHKPILLLTFIELIEKGYIWQNQIPINSILVATFKQLWDLLVSTGHQPDITQPLFYLQNDKANGNTFWYLVSVNGTSIKSHISSINTLSRKIAYGKFSYELFNLLSDTITREVIKENLLDFYFPLKKRAMRKEKQREYDLKKLEEYLLQEPAPNLKKVQSPELEFDFFVRNGNFKKFVPMIYDCKCSFTGMQTTSTFKHLLVDACHIMPFSVTQDDSIGNGLALSPTMHRAFDAGLITVDHDYKILISDAVMEDKSYPYSLSKLAKQTIFLPNDERFYPSQEKLEWHRTTRFK
ncbi:putative restriction endonuclease [Pedobacter sp. UYEF25]